MSIPTPQMSPGGYALIFLPNQSAQGLFAGTFRITEKPDTHAWRASGDLYGFSSVEELIATNPQFSTATGAPALFSPSQYQPLPVFPEAAYLYYLDVARIEPLGSNGVSVDFGVRRFDPVARQFLDGSRVHGVFQLGSRSPEPIWVLQHDTGTFFLQPLGPQLRSIRLHIVRLLETIRTPEPAPTAGITPPGWQEIFSRIGIDIQVSSSVFNAVIPKNIQAQGLNSFDLAYIFDTYKRTSASSGNEWKYTLFCIPRLEQLSALGVMFDAEATDLNERPRESAAVVALQSMTLGATTLTSQAAFDGNLYYRTALHEVGHMLNLNHSLLDPGIMNVTDFLVTKTTDAPPTFAFAPAWQFNAGDANWLQHAPDIAIRPSKVSRQSISWRQAVGRPVKVISLVEQSQFSLELQLAAPEFPLGAPVRLDFELLNKGSNAEIPADLSLSGGSVSGRVIGPDRRQRFFRSAYRSCDASLPGATLATLGGNGKASAGLTIFRGTDGPLFPEPGLYELELEVRWDANRNTFRVARSIPVLIQQATSDAHLRVAKEFLADSAVMLAVVQGLLVDRTLQVLASALATPALASHYYAIALRCFQKRRQLAAETGVPSSVRDLFTSSATPLPMVLTRREHDRLKELYPNPTAPSAPPINNDKVLRDRFLAELARPVSGTV